MTALLKKISSRIRRESRKAMHKVKLSLQGATQHEKIFTPKYGVRRLKDPVNRSYSGPGSTMKRTLALREALPALLDEIQCEVMIDAPCGDFKWMQHVNLPVKRYIGVDVIRQLVKMNSSKYGNEKRSFIHLNLIEDVLPKADVVFNRDMMIHLSYADIAKMIDRLKQSKCTYFLTSHFPEQSSNRDIQTGDWRPINLEIAPFNFPAPIAIIDEKYTVNMAYTDKCMALWKITDLPEINL